MLFCIIIVIITFMIIIMIMIMIMIMIIIIIIIIIFLFFTSLVINGYPKMTYMPGSMLDWRGLFSPATPGG